MSEVLERGDIFFAYKPRVEEDHPASIDDLQRFYVILSPDQSAMWRRLVVGRKRMPTAEGHEREWAFVDKVGRRAMEVERDLEEATYETKTRGERHQPAARPVGEGRYAIVGHGEHVHLAYALELPEAPGEPQRALNIESQASYIVTVANPGRRAPRGVGRGSSQRVEYPPQLADKFRGRRFAELDPAFLDHEGCELVLIGAREDAEHELGIHLDPQRETERDAEIFRELEMKHDREHPTRPILEGVWE